jgi:peptidyl-prolyl cis-trans isomerase D
VIDNADKAAFARANNTAIADAAFAAAPGTVVGPIKGPIAWHIVKVEKVVCRTGDDELAAF